MMTNYNPRDVKYHCKRCRKMVYAGAHTCVKAVHKCKHAPEDHTPLGCTKCDCDWCEDDVSYHLSTNGQLDN